MPQDHTHYGQKQAKEYVEYLGCWRCANPQAAVETRDTQEYLCLLRKLIAVNRSRCDKLGLWETQVARRAISRIIK